MLILFELRRCFNRSRVLFHTQICEVVQRPWKVSYSTVCSCISYSELGSPRPDRTHLINHPRMFNQIEPVPFHWLNVCDPLSWLFIRVSLIPSANMPPSHINAWRIQRRCLVGIVHLSRNNAGTPKWKPWLANHNKLRVKNKQMHCAGCSIRNFETCTIHNLKSKESSGILGAKNAEFRDQALSKHSMYCCLCWRICVAHVDPKGAVQSL